jgi:hypothetical protein
MSHGAHVTSIDALRWFKAALQEYADVLQDTLATMQVEVQRGLDWFELDRMSYWPAEVRKAQERLVEAQNRLERKRLSFDPSDSPSCHEEEQAVRRARQRLRFAEQKVVISRSWLRRVRHDVDDFRNLLAKLHHLGDSDLPRAIAILTRMIRSLEKYTDRPMQAPVVPPRPDPGSSTETGGT